MRGQSKQETGHRRFTPWSCGVAVVVLLAMAAGVRADELPPYAPAHPQMPVPLGSTRPEDGGPFAFAQYVMYKIPNPLRDQPIAIRGFQTYDQSLGTNAGDIIGSGREALNTRYLNGQVGFQPGFEVGLGWKLKDGSAIIVSWMHLTGTQYRAGATLAPARASVRNDFADSFLTAFVFNFPPEFGGSLNKITTAPPQPPASPTVAYGIWNAASVMTIQFEQRFDMAELTYRYPVVDEEDYRVQAIVGPRYAWIWERFKWRTTDIGDARDLQLGQNTAIYTNITSNRMYGVHAGCQTECYLGHGFAAMLELQGALFLNSVKERAKYETGAKFLGLPENKRAKREFTFVPEMSAMLSLQWYPTEFVQIQAGYEMMAFFNTLSSTRPIDFNYMNLAPQWDHVNRFMHGFRAGIALWF